MAIVSVKESLKGGLKMAKREKIKTEEEEKEYIEVGPQDYEDISDLEQALSGLPQDNSIIYLYRMYDRGRPKFLSKLEPGEFDLELIKESYGGGRFRYVAKKSGSIVKEGQFEIEGEPKLKHVDDGSNGSTTIGNYDVVKMLQDEVTNLKNELSKKTKEAESTLATLLSNMLQSGSHKNIDDIEASLLSKLAMYKSLFSSDKTEVPIETLFSAMTKGMEIAAAGSGDSTPLWLSVAEKLKEPLMQIAAGLSSPKVGNMPIKTVPAKTVSAKKEEESVSTNPMLSMIKPYLPIVIVAASKDSDPNIYADLVIDNIGNDQIESLKTWIMGPEWFKDLVALDNRISLQASWWTELRQCIIDRLSEGSNEDIRESSTNSKG